MTNDALPCAPDETRNTRPGEAYGLETVWNELGIYPGSGPTGGGVSQFWPNPDTIFSSYYQDPSLVGLNGGILFFVTYRTLVRWAILRPASPSM